MVKLTDLKPYEKNAKAHPAGQIDKIVNSIREFGFNVPLLIDMVDAVIAGHGRLLAAQKLGLSEVPCIRMEHLNEQQIKAFRIADNKVGESDWEYDFLQNELADLDKGGFDIELTGFSKSEIALLTGTSEIDEPEFDENIKTENKCPKCGYSW